MRRCGWCGKVDEEARGHGIAVWAFGHSQRVFLANGQLSSIGLRQMFDIAAQGSHRARALREHSDPCHAIVNRKPQATR